MKETVQIAIDGPAGAGKSTVAKILAQELGFIYIDTGAMYRALTYKLMEQNLNINDISSIITLAQNINITFDNRKGFKNQLVFCDGQDITQLIRSPGVNNLVSKVASIPEIREIMVQKQRNLSMTANVIMDGRDIGTVVLPNAKYKFFLTASLEERATRRLKELREKGYDVQYESVVKEISKRDYQDATRDVAPLKPAQDAIIIDTSNFTLAEVVAKITKIVLGEDKSAL